MTTLHTIGARCKRSYVDDTNKDTMLMAVAKLEMLIAQMRANPANVKFTDVEKVCRDYFGEPRQQGTSHQVYKTPWVGDPRINIQRDKGGKAKGYQVREIVQAIDKLTGLKDDN